MDKITFLYRGGIILLIMILIAMFCYYENRTAEEPYKERTSHTLQDSQLPDASTSESSKHTSSTEATIDADTEETSYDSKGHKKTFVHKREHIVIKSDNYDVNTTRNILIQWHAGGKRCDVDEMKETVAAVMQRMPNLQSTSEFKALLMETMIIETDLGGEKWRTGISKWKNYGIAQFRLDTAKGTLKWLEGIRPDVYRQVMSFYDKKKDLTNNLTYNIPFSIALMAQYYWRVTPDVALKIGTLKKRATIWKNKYNTKRGKGTVNGYIARVTRFNKSNTTTVNIAQIR